MIQIIHFFKKKFKLYLVLTYTFFKTYISKIHYGFFYIYNNNNNLEFNWI